MYKVSLDDKNTHLPALLFSVTELCAFLAKKQQKPINNFFLSSAT